MAENKLLEPGQKLKPSIKSDEVIQIIVDLYQIQVVEISELNSYDDRNFFIKSNDGKKYVFKISNYLDSSCPGLIGEFLDIKVTTNQCLQRN